MKATDRVRLTAALREQVAAIAVDLRGKLRGLHPGSADDRARALRLHADERVGEDFDVWTDLLSRRAAVLWVLKSVYVRVLEDRGLLAPGRLLDPDTQLLFERLAPNLGETAFLRWIYRDLASARGGLPELFSPQPAEIAAPSDACSRRLIDFWRHRDADTGAAWSFADERFEGELMGDLYQELDPVVKDRFALCQTPDFVRAFILDQTLTPALDAFGPETVRVIDPACGSGHFLIDALKRLVAATSAAHPERPRRDVVADALARVVGVDLNDYACGLARARLVMTAAELAGLTSLSEASAFHPQVYWADGLEQVEREEARPVVQFDLFEPVAERPRAVLTRSDVRAALRPVFAPKFHAVVANPPYITEKDDARKDYHRELIGKRPRYVSAYRQYSLGCPFVERCFQLAAPGAFVGVITSNNFMKREFGKPLIEQVLPQLDLSLVVDTSQAYIPFHGTPTVLLFGRNQKPTTPTVRAVMGKRGESGTPADPARGHVWTSIADGWHTPGFETAYVSVADLPRPVLSAHPWSLAGGGAAELKSRLEQATSLSLSSEIKEIGRTNVVGHDDVWVRPPRALARQDLSDYSLPFVIGEVVRDWCITGAPSAIYPYESMGGRPLPPDHVVTARLWPYRALLERRTVFGKEMKEHGRAWWEHLEHYAERLRTPLSIAFAFVATHNHFVLDRGGKVFKQSAPVIKLPAGATEDDHLALLGLLNSSTACFWMKQVFYPKGGDKTGDGGRRAVEGWHDRFEFDSTKMQGFPVTNNRQHTLPYARALDGLAATRAARSVAAVLAEADWQGAAGLRAALGARREADTADFRRMVALQEELDWRTYALYGLDAEGDAVPADAVEPLEPVALPWALALAAEDRAIREALARGEATEGLPTDWFARHGWTPAEAPPAALSPATRARIAARMARTAANPALGLIENANCKRRWYRPDHDAEEQTALREWLADRVEAAAQARKDAFTCGQLVAALQDDARVLAVCEVLTGRPDFSLAALVTEAVQGDAVPSHPSHVYKPTGRVKRAVWERTWADQRREDAGEPVTPEVPPAYDSKDFLRPELWSLRGKLDVPKERFIAFTEAPGKAGAAQAGAARPDGAEALYGWAGWTALQRLRALLSLDERLEDAGHPLADRIGVLDSAWRLLPDVAREDAGVASRLKAELAALVGPTGPSPEQVADWEQRFPPTAARAPRAATPKKTTPRTRKSQENEEDA